MRRDAKGCEGSNQNAQLPAAGQQSRKKAGSLNGNRDSVCWNLHNEFFMKIGFWLEGECMHAQVFRFLRPGPYLTHALPLEAGPHPRVGRTALERECQNRDVRVSTPWSTLHVHPAGGGPRGGDVGSCLPSPRPLAPVRCGLAASPSPWVPRAIAGWLCGERVPGGAGVGRTWLGASRWGRGVRGGLRALFVLCATLRG